MTRLSTLKTAVAAVALMSSAVFGAAAVADPAPAPAPAVKPAGPAPMTREGKPDLTGTWTNASLTTLTRPRGVDKLVVSPEEATKIAKSTAIAGISPEDAAADEKTDPKAGAPAKGGKDFGIKGYNLFWVAPGENLARVKGEYRTSYVVDPPNGQLPLSAAGMAANAERAKGFVRYATGIGGNEGPEVTGLSERCLIGFGGTGGPGMLSVLYNNTYAFTQTPTTMAILVEMAHDARIIPIYASADEARAHHKPPVIKPWLGDTVGWWDGSTFVAETINVRPEQARNHPFLISEKGKVTERFQRISDQEIFYTFTVDDPTYYTKPWTAELSFYSTPNEVNEYACHEGNYAIPGILRGARLKEEQEGAAVAKAKPVAAKTKAAAKTN